MTLFSRAIPCALAAFLVIAADEPPAGDVVAQRGDVRLTATDLRDTLSLLDPAARAQVTASPQALANFVRDRVLNMSVLSEARAKNWDSQPEILRRMNEARDTVILQTYLSSQVAADPLFPSEAEITTAYEANKGRLISPRMFHVAQIVLMVKPGATPEEEAAAHKKAIDVRAAAIRPNADFAELARKNSQDARSAEKGGDVGWLREPDMVPAVREAVQGLAEHGVSQPIHVPDGWHVLKLLEIKPGGQVPLLEAKPQIVQALRQARAQQMMRTYLDNMLKAKPIEVNEIELTKQVGTAR